MGPVLMAQAPALRVPALLMHGDSDRIADCKASEELHKKLSSTDKSLKIYNGYYHEIFNDLGKEEVFQDMTNWLLERT